MIEALLRAYRNTTYRVFIHGEAIDVRIGEKNARLDVLLDGAPWAFISASNPASRPADDNPARHRALIEKLEGPNYRLHPGVGIPDEGDWAAEESVLVAGMSEADAILIGREFGQNAIVAGAPHERARLVFCVVSQKQ